MIGPEPARRALLWDIDGTFALTESLHFESLLTVSGRYGARLGPELQSELVGWSARRAHRHLCETRGLRVDFERWAGERYQYYRERAPGIQPRPGALAVWRSFAEQGLAQALVSNSDRLLVDLNIHALGLNRPGLISVSRNDVRRGKPDPEPYLRAAYLLGLDVADCTVIEDTPSGARAGLAAGMRVAVWPEDFGLDFPEGVQTLADIAELVPLLENPEWR